MSLSLDERKAKAEKAHKERLDAIEAERVRQSELAELDKQIADVRGRRAALLEELAPLIEKRSTLIKHHKQVKRPDEGAPDA